MVTEADFRKLCRTTEGSLEAEAFQKALDSSNDDTVAVTFNVGIDETKIVKIPRHVCEKYAIIAKEENGPESDLLNSINPRMHGWAKMNRDKVCRKIIEAMGAEEKVPGQGIVLLWPLCAPDQVSESVAKNYLERYS